MKIFANLIIAASLLLVACSEQETAAVTSAPQVKYDCQVTFGWEPRQPYQFYENKQMQGIDVEILQAATKAANCELVFIEKDWTNLLSGVEKGEIDILAGATPTAERQKYADFSVPYRNESFALFVSSNTTFNGDNLSDFLSYGNKIGIASDYYYGDDVYNLMQHPQYGSLFKARGSNQQSFFNLQSGIVNGVLSDPIEGQYIIKRKGWTNAMRLSSVTVPSDAVAFMFSKKSSKQEKLLQVKDHIKKMVTENQINGLIAKYQ